MMTPEIPNVGHAAQQQSTSQSNLHVFYAMGGDWKHQKSS